MEPVDDKLYIPVVTEVIGESKTDEQRPNQTPDPPVEVFINKASNALEWSVAEKLIKAGTISSVGVEKRS